MAAATKNGDLIVARDRHSERCSATTAKGLPCPVWALRDGSGLCGLHADPDAARERGRKGGRARQQERREEAGLRKSSGHRQAMPGPTLARVIEVVAELLDAEIPDGTHEPDMLVRGVGVLAAASLFGLRPDQKPEILELIEKIRPNLATDPQIDRLLRVEEASAALVREVEEGRLDVSHLPPWLIADLSPGFASSAVAASRAA